MKKTIATLITLLVSLTAVAENVVCIGRTNQASTTSMDFQINVENKTSLWNPSIINYDSNIVYFDEKNEPYLTSGIDISFKLRKKLNQYIFSGASDNYLELNMRANSDQIEKSYLNAPLAGFFRQEIYCSVEGELPQRPVCTSFADKSRPLLDALKTNSSADGDLIETMIECGANINSIDSKSCTPLMLVVDALCGSSGNFGHGPKTSLNQNTVQIVDVFLNSGAFVNSVDENKETVLIKAAKYNVRNVYKSFIAAEADFDAQDKDGMTALMYAAINGDRSIIEEILLGKPDLKITNKNGMTAYNLAIHWGKHSVVDLLKIPDVAILVEGKSDGTCAPLQFSLKQNQTVEIVLKAADKMFKLDSAKLGIDLMASANSSDKQIFVAKNKGNFNFTCGLHGAIQPSKGTITIQ